MRVFFSAVVGLMLLATACSGSSGGGTTGSSGGAGTTGTSGGLLAAGSPCTSNAACQSNICGPDGTGNCCLSACASVDPPCGATDCGDTGACTYPGSGTSCGTASCSGSVLSSAGSCDGSGTCAAGSQSSCNDHFACGSATACATICTSSTDCVSGFFCVADAGACDAQSALGPCTENDACASGVCGINGTGHCCATACTNTTAPCGATDCDTSTAACTFPASGAACGTVPESCTGSTQQDPSACDGTGNCNNAPGTTACTPYICGASACLASCTDNSSCDTGSFCDVANTTCCTGLSAIGTLAVDSKNGSDAAACCGIGANGPCQTLNQAMKLIDSAQAQSVTLTATVGGAGGDWAPAKEVYPIVLGWGVELNAAGVYFRDVSGAPAIFNIDFYSAGDSVGYASIVGTAASPVSIGMDSLGNQSTDTSAIEVEPSGTLYIANATVNGNASMTTTAITVNAGAALWLAQDKSAGVTGTVTIGNDDANSATDGYNGIVCLTAKGLGCTVSDSTLMAGGSSVVIEGQEGVDIDAEDNAVITLTASPIIGIPSRGGRIRKLRESKLARTVVARPQTEAILLNGSATMTFSNGTVQCISGDGFVLQAADNLKTVPTLSLSSSTIQNTEFALYATAEFGLPSRIPRSSTTTTACCRAPTTPTSRPSTSAGTAWAPTPWCAATAPRASSGWGAWMAPPR